MTQNIRTTILSLLMIVICLFSTLALSADFNGDGKDDVLWRNNKDGTTWIWLMDGKSISLSQPVNTISLDWRIAGHGDFDGDGKADILWRNTTTGKNWLYLMDGVNISASHEINTVANQYWQVKGVTDFDGDGKTDIFWHNQDTGQTYVYLMNGYQIKQSTALFTIDDTNWQVAAVGDVNGDNKSDVIWRHTTQGHNYIWLMDGSNVVSRYLLNTVDVNWEITGAGDINGDGVADILWRNKKDGRNWTYLMNNGQIQTSRQINTIADQQWQIQEIADFNGDGTDDIFWFHQGTGNTYLYIMVGAAIDSSSYLETLSLDWMVISTNSSTDTKTSIVTASIEPLAEVNAAEIVFLDASSSTDSLNGTLTYSWQQTSGTSVDILNANDALASFISPDATAEIQTLTFQITVSSATASDIATVTATIAALETNQPNILFIISDDQGLDTSAQYNYSSDLPVTPTINALAADGIIFDNAWATPACTTTRGTIITGKYGVNSGVTHVPAVLNSESNDQDILQEYLQNNAESSNYVSALFGKWHLGGGSNVVEASHPNDVGLDYYAGNLENLSDYNNWTLTINGMQETSTDYHTSKITDLAIDWLSNQTSPWFAWVAYSAPHSPYHLPPIDLHNRTDLSGESDDITANKRDYYLASVEAMDSEISRLLASMDQGTRDNTIIIYLGDNGTPKAVIDTTTYQTSHAKGTLYQGGIAVPLVISGKGVTRIGEREGALVTATDLYATIGQLAGIEQNTVHDSNSFVDLLVNNSASSEDYVFTAFQSDDVTGWSVRSADYKLITYEDGSKELFDLTESFSESNNTNLLPSSDNTINNLVNDLTTYATNITGEVDLGPIDITNAILTNTNGNCADYVESYTSTVNDINNSVVFMGDLAISVIGDKCIFNTNEIPNHDFNDGAQKFPNDVSEQDSQLEVTATPTIASNTTDLSLQVDNALLLNGVKVDLLAAACYGVGGQPKGQEKIGCNDGNDWRYDPMYIDSGFNVDTHNAHSQPNGSYHYHGSPLALFSDSSNSNVSPVIGFAADGFPIFGSYFDDNGTIRKAVSSYQLKTGNRPSGSNEPGEAGGPFSSDNYDGRFIDDYEYVPNAGDLDKCNGMTINGVYAYYVTESYPYVIGCYSGTPDESFHK